MKTFEYRGQRITIPYEFNQYRIFDPVSGVCFDFWSDNIKEAINFTRMQQLSLMELKILIDGRWVIVSEEIGVEK